jgi:hypothetical protein
MNQATDSTRFLKTVFQFHGQGGHRGGDKIVKLRENSRTVGGGFDSTVGDDPKTDGRITEDIGGERWDS